MEKIESQNHGHTTQIFLKTPPSSDRNGVDNSNHKSFLFSSSARLYIRDGAVHTPKTHLLKWVPMNYGPAATFPFPPDTLTVCHPT